MHLCVIMTLKGCVIYVTLKNLKIFLYHKLWQSFNSVLLIFCAFVAYLDFDS